MMVCIMIEPLQQELIIFSLALYLHILNHWLQYLTIIHVYVKQQQLLSTIFSLATLINKYLHVRKFCAMLYNNTSQVNIPLEVALL